MNSHGLSPPTTMKRPHVCEFFWWFRSATRKAVVPEVELPHSDFGTSPGVFFAGGVVSKAFSSWSTCFLHSSPFRCFHEWVFIVFKRDFVHRITTRREVFSTQVRQSTQKLEFTDRSEKACSHLVSQTRSHIDTVQTPHVTRMGHHVY